MTALFALITVTAPLVSAVMMSERCFNDTHVEIAADWVVTVNESGTSYNYTQLMMCANNCSTTTQRCRGVIKESQLGNVTLMSGILSITFLWLSTIMRKEHGALQTLFMFMGLILMINTTGLMYQVSEMSSASTQVLGRLSDQMWIMSVVLWIFTAYFMILFLKGALESVNPKNKKGADGLTPI